MKALQLLVAILACLATLVVANRKPYRPWLPRKCRLKYSKRHDCGYKGIPPDQCRAKGCCYDEVPREDGINVPWCFKSSTDKFITNKLLTVLAAEGVDSDLILALYADANPGAEWLLAFKNGGLNTGHLLKMIGGDLNIDPFYLKILSGEDPIKLLLEKIAKQMGLKEEYLGYFADGNTEVILKHILYLVSAQNGNPSVPYSILTDLLSGKKLDSKKLLENYVEQLLPKGDKFTTEFYKALYSGNREEAIQWAYLSAFRYKFPQKGLYPQNSGLFMSLVMTQKNFPGKISPSIILALAKGEILPGINSDGQTFKQLFGVKAKDYICAAHDPSLQTACGPLKGRLYTSARECEEAGCCLMQAINGKSAMCFDNVLGSIGTFLAQNVIDEHYINETILEGNLPSIEDFIPWLPNNELPTRYQNWYGDGTRIETFADPYPTVLSLKPNKYRKDFKWKPHGPTSIPFEQKLPFEFLVPTIEPGVINPYPGGDEEASEAPIITQLELKGFSSICRAVLPKDRVECMSNSKALKDDGAECVASDCCYDPDWSDLNTPACFRLITYGQCYKVAYEEREDCGREGIKREECLQNPQCCYDTALPIQEFYKGTPWCYYKKRAPILPKDTCARASERKPCLSSSTLNGIVSKENCEYLGCCYEKVKVSFFDQVIGYSEASPTCFKPAEYDLTPTEEPDEEDPTEEVCQYKHDMEPHHRVPCGDITSFFECRLAECCYERIYFDTQFPWCFRKSTVAVSR
ncbi:uncharacterized protein LOC120326445 [Styela clava]|uniref:uncharacterized protein LOC120326445 n=1 Tax=Styela clava TaxID=7725 RepID=UPI0019398949|nr:uncharacterized protein LOC120326445 [Styela clava]